MATIAEVLLHNELLDKILELLSKVKSFNKEKFHRDPGWPIDIRMLLNGLGGTQWRKIANITLRIYTPEKKETLHAFVAIEIPNNPDVLATLTLALGEKAKPTALHSYEVDTGVKLKDLTKEKVPKIIEKIAPEIVTSLAKFILIDLISSEESS